MTKKKTCDGTINGKPVKLIIVDNGWGNQYFAKPKHKDVIVPHFIDAKGTLQVHEDSADNNSFRVMNVNTIYSGSCAIGSTFASNKGMDFAVLPMNETANGFAINTSAYGASVSIPSDSEWCLMAFGTYGTWQRKPNH